jgi:ribosomal protein S18 acetylase RimI-like enzyme
MTETLSSSEPHGRPAALVLRPAEPTDLPMLYRSELMYMREIESEHVDKWLQAVDRNLELWATNLSRARVIDIGGQPAGIMLWMPLPEGVAVLVTIHVLPEFRRQGLGQHLLERFVADASASGCSTLNLGVHKNNPARGLYEKADFERTHADSEYLYYSMAVRASDRVQSARSLPGNAL